MGLNVKAFLEKNGDVKGEIRRFQVSSPNPTDLFRLVNLKVAEVFALPENGFQMFWQDMDGDFVIFSSTVEMQEALHHSTDGVLRIFVKRTAGQDKTTGGDKGGDGEKGPEEKVHHPGVVCDGCEGSIYGPRYKCVICPDYDLCSACEQKGLHPEHDKFKITHPQTAGGHGGFMPPHFRRWMHRFMKKCPAGQGPCPTGGATAAAGGASTSSEAAGESSTGAQPQGSSSGNGDEFLNDIGANIAAFLDPFGIDVSYEVKHGDEKKKGHFRTNGQSAGGRSGQGAGGRCGPGNWGQANWGQGNWGPGMWQWAGTFGNAGGCTRMPQGAKPSTSAEGEKPAEKPEQKAEEKVPEQAAPEKAGKENEAEMEEVQVTLEEEMPAPETKETPCSKEASPTGSQDEDWTMLNEGETATDGEGVPREGLYPNLKVTQAVEMMKAMGFNDDGGWLTRLLETTDGDIAQALDTLKLGAQQASLLK